MSFDNFDYFVDVCEKISLTTSKNIKVKILSEYLSNIDEYSLPISVQFLSGRIFPKDSELSLNLGFTTVINSLSEIAKLNINEIQQIHLKYGDAGKLAEYALTKKHTIPLFQRQLLTLPYIYSRLKKIANTKGSGSNKEKKKILTGLLSSCSPLEGKYLIKIINGGMRIGLVEGLVELAIAEAFNHDIEKIREAMLFSDDIGKVSTLAKNGFLITATITPLKPLSFMLADVMFTAEEVINYYQKPLICEYKYDGIRMQIHKFKDEVKMFSRKLDNVTYAFPELVHCYKECIIIIVKYEESRFYIGWRNNGF